MTASSPADAGVFASTRLGHAVARTAITAVLAVVFGLPGALLPQGAAAAS